MVKRQSMGRSVSEGLGVELTAARLDGFLELLE